MNVSDLKQALDELFHAVDGPKAAMFWIRNLNIMYTTFAMAEEGPVEKLVGMESRVCAALLAEIAKKMALPRVHLVEQRPMLFWRVPPTLIVTNIAPGVSTVEVRMRLAIPDIEVGIAYWRSGGGDHV